MNSDQIIIDLSYLYSITGGDKSFEYLLLSGTVLEVDKKISELEISWKDNDPNGVRKNAHSLISLAAIAGMPQVEGWSRRIDHAFADELFHPEYIALANNIISGWPIAFLQLKQLIADSENIQA